MVANRTAVRLLGFDSPAFHMRPFKNWYNFDPNRSFFEYNGPQLFDAPLNGNISTTERWRGPFLRIGNMRFKIERLTTRHQAEGYPDRVDWGFHFYYDRANTYKGDRKITYKGA